MNEFLAVIDQSYALLGLVPAAILGVALLINVASMRGKDMNRNSGVAINLLFIALLIESAAWTIRTFGGGTTTGVFWTVVAAAFMHVLSGMIALRAFWEHATIGRWPHGRRRATWGFLLNVAALLAISGWFYLGINTQLYRRIFE